MTETWYKPKLIEVGLPLEDINRESAREKSIRHGHPSIIHMWWARRPLAACRAVLFAQLVDDPSAHPEQFPTEESQRTERERLHQMISRLVVWENTHDKHLFQEARKEILKSTGDNPPPILDPFAGGASIPLEAQRFGLEAHASDLNPVAVLINKALIELPPKWEGHTPIFPNSSGERMSWPGATGLAEDVRRYGNWMRDAAEDRIGHLYPKVKISGLWATVIAWIWARTVTCPNPVCSGTMPLVRSFWLSKKKGKECYITPIPNGKYVRFEINGPDGTPRDGTVSRTGAVCLLCETPVPFSYIREEGKAGRMGSQLMAIAADGKGGRYYSAPDERHEDAANVPPPSDAPDEELGFYPGRLNTVIYGLTRFSQLFTNRQLTMLSTFTSLVREARERAIKDGADASYADAIALYLALAASKATAFHTSTARWRPGENKTAPAFGRQAIPMVWDFAETNPFGGAGGDWLGTIDGLGKLIASLPATPPATVSQQNAANCEYKDGLVATDPPYYDNVGYALLSDYFYVWLRKSLSDTYPELMGTLLTPKTDELIADPYRLDGKVKAEKFFQEGFEQVFHRVREDTYPDYPITVFYAYKQTETSDDGQQASTGWDTLLEGLIRAGWSITATWPMQTESKGRILSHGQNTLASSIVLSCRPRPINSGVTDRRGLIQALRNELPEALRKLEHGKVAPVDLRQAAIGPGMAVFSRYARVNEPDGTQMRVRAALSLINQVLEEKLAQIGGEVSADTRFCVEWFKQFGFDSGPFGTADVLARGVDTAVSGLERAEILTSRAGKVKLLSIQELPDNYDPTADERTSEWEICLHLAKELQLQGADTAARLMAASRNVPGIDLDDVKELAYLLYTIAEKKNWVETALLFNDLGTSWTDIDDASRKVRASSGTGQEEFTLEYGSDDDGDE